MTPLSQLDLNKAAQNYMVANTPLFLLRKLREDEAVHEISHGFSGDEILGAMRAAMEKEPQELLDYARPYVYLMALSFDPDDSFLRQAVAMPLSDAQKWSWDWFDYLRQVLLETYSPTSSQSLVSQPRTVAAGDRVICTDAPAEEQQFRIA